jgi:hypothetical protein
LQMLYSSWYEALFTSRDFITQIQGFPLRKSRP